MATIRIDDELNEALKKAVEGSEHRSVTALAVAHLRIVAGLDKPPPPPGRAPRPARAGCPHAKTTVHGWGTVCDACGIRVR